ncbi:hypothetical protein BIV57_13295 [Mangrovactinospora gilvigrisea]|uniref:AAA+ ATPase domain-containing protein n=1 Tax=Mangrovactinospora gilvigrisea TaxID=1428644 RepID=A0A1J7BE57_9ACTN|nr:hypothetical protein [Mangrovactinospora gilvigrisea]OIV36963.1 hypothetical protein BIV57_13295 [Mangrovactinospora gilvigrisea]
MSAHLHDAAAVLHIPIGVDYDLDLVLPLAVGTGHVAISGLAASGKTELARHFDLAARSMGWGSTVLDGLGMRPAAFLQALEAHHCPSEHRPRMLVVDHAERVPLAGSSILAALTRTRGMHVVLITSPFGTDPGRKFADRIWLGAPPQSRDLQSFLHAHEEARVEELHSWREPGDHPRTAVWRTAAGSLKPFTPYPPLPVAA